MSSFNQFTYSEVSISVQNSLPEYLRFDKKINKLGILIRLLTGTIKIEENVSGKLFRPRINYSKIKYLQNTRISKVAITSFLNEGYDSSHLNTYLQRTIPYHHLYYKELLNEFTCYFYNKNNKNYSLAFINLYRILEFISYSLPMIYAANSKNYLGTYDKLKNYFKGSDSELKFFDLFIKDIISNSVLSSRLKFDITAFNEDIRNNYFQILKKICDEDGHINLKNEDKPSFIEIDYASLMHLVINLRNRYFHFLSGKQKNISSTQLIDPDSFFSFLNDDIVNWLSVIIFEIIRKEIEE